MPHQNLPTTSETIFTSINELRPSRNFLHLRLHVLIVVVVILADPQGRAGVGPGTMVEGVSVQKIPSCLEGRDRCQKEDVCRSLLVSVEGVCGDSPYTCKETLRDQCSALLSSLQSHQFFRNCICDPLQHDTRSCTDFQRNIFLHSCVAHEGAVSNISWIIPTASEFDEDDDDDESLGPEVTFEDLEERQASCLGVWKSCAGRARCAEALQKFRRDCKENRRARKCLASDWSSCYESINYLTRESEELVTCKCHHINKQHVKDKCNKMRSKLIGNVCLDTISYFFHTSLLPELSFHQQRSLVYKTINSINLSEKANRNRNCVWSFHKCNEDPHCSAHLESYLNSCNWDGTSQQCHRNQCLLQIRNFYARVKQELTHSMLFCTCTYQDYEDSKNKVDKDLCQSLRKLLLPTCSRVDLPPPTCNNVMDRCSAVEECRKSWNDFVKNCPYDPNHPDRCHLSVDCAVSLVSMIGGPLTLNCTCPTHLMNTNETSKCMEFKAHLTARDICLNKEGNFHISNFTTTSPLDGQSHVIDDVNNTSSHQFKDAVNLGCQRSPTLSHHIPAAKPQFLRRYIGDANDCSVVCSCTPTKDQYTCLPLTCSPTEVCRVSEGAQVHNSMKVFPDKGLCRCTRGEMVCTKSQNKIDVKEGLFLHAGYSKSEKSYVTEQTGLHFDHVATKLNLLIQQQQQQQRSTEARDCFLSLLSRSETNFVFEVLTTRNDDDNDDDDDDDDDYLPAQYCMAPSKSLSNLINSQHFSISEDAELSILKVAQLEKVQFHNHHQHHQHHHQHQQNLQRNRFYDFFGDSMASAKGHPLLSICLSIALMTTTTTWTMMTAMTTMTIVVVMMMILSGMERAAG